jgi:hypothetical protein
MDLEKKEFMLVVDATNGLMLTDGMSLKDQIFADVVDSMALDKTDEKWELDKNTLTEKMRKADENEYKELWKNIEEFWRKNDQNNG